MPKSSSFPHLIPALVCFLAALAARAEVPVRVVTEEFPPFQYMEKGHLTGVCVEVVKAVLAEAGIQAEITMMPWARAQKTAKEEENVLIFSLARTEAREKDYKWVGQIDEAHNQIFAAAGSPIEISRFDDLKDHVLGVVIGDLREEYFVERGFVVGKNLQPVRSHASMYAMLAAKRLDLWPENELAMAYIVRQSGRDPATAVKPVWSLPDITPYSGDFMAFGLSTSDSVVARLRTALERIKTDGRFAAIMRKWGVGS